MNTQPNKCVCMIQNYHYESIIHKNSNHRTNTINKNKINENDMRMLVMMTLIHVESLVVVCIILDEIRDDVLFHSEIQNFAPKRRTQN